MLQLLDKMKEACKQQDYIAVSEIYHEALKNEKSCKYYTEKRSLRNIRSLYDSFMADYFEVRLYDISTGLDYFKINLKRKEILQTKTRSLLEKFKIFVSEEFNKSLFELGRNFSIKIQISGKIVEAGILLTKIDYVITGRDGWLFLQNDRNNSKALHAGDILLSDESRSEWETFADKAKDRGIEIVIAPSKENVFRNYYPYPRGEFTLYNNVLEIFKQRGIPMLDSVPLLNREQQTFSKTDTHWTFYGACIVFCEIIKRRFMIDLKSEFEFFDSFALGDLGSKVWPYEESLINYVKIPNLEPVCTNNFPQDGLLSIWENDESILNSSCVIFGDSYSRYFYPFAYKIFKRCVAVRSAGNVIDQIIQYEHADIVITERAERFCNQAPRFYDKITDLNLMFKGNGNIKIANCEIKNPYAEYFNLLM